MHATAPRGSERREERLIRGSDPDDNNGTRDSNGDGIAGMPDAQRWRIALFVGFALLVSWVALSTSFDDRGEELTYSTFLSQVDEDRVASVVIVPDGRIEGDLGAATQL